MPLGSRAGLRAGFGSGPPVAAEMHQRLDAANIPVEPAPIRALRGQGSVLQAVVLADGRQVPRAGLFLRPRLFRRAHEMMPAAWRRLHRTKPRP